MAGMKMMSHIEIGDIWYVSMITIKKLNPAIESLLTCVVSHGMPLCFALCEMTLHWKTSTVIITTTNVLIIQCQCTVAWRRGAFALLHNLQHRPHRQCCHSPCWPRYLTWQFCALLLPQHCLLLLHCHHPHYHFLYNGLRWQLEYCSLAQCPGLPHLLQFPDLEPVG